MTARAHRPGGIHGLAGAGPASGFGRPSAKGVVALAREQAHRRAMPAAPKPKFAPLPVTQLDADGTFRGYASLFGRVDLGRDRIVNGAFARSLAERGPAGVRMLFQHDPTEVIGSWRTIREDARGLYVEGHLSPDVARAREVRALMRSGALDGLSIGFHTVRARKDAASGIRSILEADLWEISVVTFPMQPDARVSEVKGLRHAPPGGRASPRAIERMLRRDAGLSRTEAKALVARLGGPPGRRDAAPEPLVARIRRAAALLTPPDRTERWTTRQ